MIPSGADTIDSRVLQQLLQETKEPRQTHIRQACLHALASGSFAHYGTSIVSANNLYDIYERRSKYEHLTAKGFDVAVPALKECGNSPVRLHGFETNDVAYVIFTDPPAKTLLGIIAVNREKNE